MPSQYWVPSLETIYIYLFPLLCEESQDTKVSTAKYINVGCVNISALLVFFNQTQEAEEEMLLRKYISSL